MYYLKKVITCSEVGECRETVLNNACESDLSNAYGTILSNTSKSGDAELWITDSASKGRALLAEKKAVLIWLHEGNCNQDFSAFRYACDNPAELDRDYLEGIYRRFWDIPWDILETERCLVRETTIADVDEFYRMYREPSIVKYMEPLYDDPQRERAYARDYIDKVYSFYGFGIWTVLEKPSSGQEALGEGRESAAEESEPADGRAKVIGRAGIGYREGYEEPEIGFVIAADKQGRGYATEVCGAIMRYGHQALGFERILAFVQPQNKASLRVCEKLGMSPIGMADLQGVQHVMLKHDTKT